MDYIFWSAIRGMSARRLVVSYDIACQWNRKLLLRAREMPPDLVPENVKDLLLAYFVPKFHVAAHRVKCQSQYSLNVRRGVGRTDGENIERGWASANSLAGSTKEMGPGARRDTLDDHWLFWNWRILAKLGTYFFIHLQLSFLLSSF